MKYCGRLAFSSEGTGHFHCRGDIGPTLVFKIYGDSKEEIREAAKAILNDTTAAAREGHSEAYNKDFASLPAKALEKMDQDRWCFELSYDPYEAVGGASWDLEYQSGNPVVLVLQ